MTIQMIQYYPDLGIGVAFKGEFMQIEIESDVKPPEWQPGDRWFIQINFIIIPN